MAAGCGATGRNLFDQIHIRHSVCRFKASQDRFTQVYLSEETMFVFAADETCRPICVIDADGEVSGRLAAGEEDTNGCLCSV